MANVLKLGRNLRGQDFVVGDIHGAFDLVVEAMARVQFDPKADRLFSVGDLIDRGPGSHRCAAFLAKPYVHAVRGNHEDMLLQLYAEGPPDPEALKWAARHNGFGWWLDTPEAIRRDVLAAIKGLPLAIELETARGTVGLVHADVPIDMPWAEFLAKLAGGDPEVTQACLWGRDRAGKSPDHSGVSGVGRVFVGHTPQWHGAARYGNVYAVDTGAVFGQLGIKDGGRLTMAQVALRTAVLVEPRAAIALIDLRGDDGEANATTPFGAYAQPGTGWAAVE